MRFSVECAFPHLGKRGVGSRKDALCTRRLTENRTLHRRCHLDVTKGRILDGRRHGKAHFAVSFTYYMPVAKAAEMAATLVSTGVQGLASRRKAQVRSPAARQGA